MVKSAEAFRTISEVADDLGIPKHVLRFWEVKFAQIRPMKRGGGRRYYRPADLELLRGIRHLLHRDGYTIKGVQKILREQGVEAVKQHASLASASERSAPNISSPNSDRLEIAETASSASSHRLVEPQRKRAGNAPKGRSKSVTHIVASAIAELEACRAILRGEAQAAPAGNLRGSRVGGER